MGFLGKWFGARSAEGRKVDNTALLRAIQNVASADSPQHWAKLYRLLLDCVLFVPVREIPEGLQTGAGITAHPVDISLLQLRDKQQKPVTPAFTDEEALRNWDPNTPFLGIKAREYFRMVKGTEISAIVINPFDPIRKMLRPGGRITRFEFEALAEGIVPGRPDASGAVHMTLAEGKPVRIGSAANPPSEEILQAVAAAGRGMAEIKELYLFEMSNEAGDGHAVIGIELARRVQDARLKQILENLAQAVHPLLTGRNYVDFMVLNDSLGDAVRTCGKKLLGRE